MERSSGAHVAFLTQDSLPADGAWLARPLAAFELADRVALAFGPYRPQPGASVMVRRELASVFDPLGDEPRLDDGPFFSSANGCVAREAWERVPFRAVAYAEDRMLARDMLSAGWSKAYHPAAAVIHSHEYPLRQRVQRSFDEGRGMLEVNGFRGHSLTAWPLVVQRAVRDDATAARAEGTAGPGLWARSLAHHAAGALGGALGGRADRIPRRARRLLSLEGHAGLRRQGER
jgi:rhamnosyltransferase